MKLRNEFSQETKELFFWNKRCFFCGRLHANSFHHIFGRVSDSPLNCCPINNFDCHIGNGKLSQDETIKKLLSQTLKYLLENNYKLTKKDRDFVKDHIDYY